MALGFYIVLFGLLFTSPVWIFLLHRFTTGWKKREAERFWRERFADDANSDDATLLRASDPAETRAGLLRPIETGAPAAGPPQELLRAGAGGPSTPPTD